MAEIGKHITLTEQRADSAEKELKAVLILQMLAKMIGEELSCVTTGLTNFGVFVQCKKFGIDGLIQMEDLGSDQWKFDKNTQSILGLRSGVSIRLGQSLKARIVLVNIAARQLNLAPAEELIKSTPRRAKTGKGKKREPVREKSQGKKPKRQKTGRRNKGRR